MIQAFKLKLKVFKLSNKLTTGIILIWIDTIDI